MSSGSWEAHHLHCLSASYLQSLSLLWTIPANFLLSSADMSQPMSPGHGDPSWFSSRDVIPRVKGSRTGPPATAVHKAVLTSLSP